MVQRKFENILLREMTSVAAKDSARSKAAEAKNLHMSKA